MQLIENSVHNAQYRVPWRAAGCQRYQAGDRGDAAATLNRLLIVLSCGFAAVIGPGILDAVARTSFTASQLLLEICRMCLVAYQVFGR
jgi:hypothetical protein